MIKNPNREPLFYDGELRASELQSAVDLSRDSTFETVISELRREIARYSWPQLAKEYDEQIELVASERT